MTERKMVTVRKIKDILPIEDADAIEVAVVDGWKVVVKKGEFKPGDDALYFEIDSFLPDGNPQWQFLVDKSSRMFNGKKGHVLRTVRLRGQISQGLLLPMNENIRLAALIFDRETKWPGFDDFDMSPVLGVSKYEAEIPAQLAGEVKGNFPSFIQKTDQERIQNLTDELVIWKDAKFTWEVTEKLDGSSMTVYMNNGEFGVCSRNLELKRNPDNSLWKVAIREQLEEKLIGAGANIALQGELIGAGIQGNKYKLKDQQFFLFDIYDINAGEYFTPIKRKNFVEEWNIKHVPVITSDFSLIGKSVDDLLQFAEGKSVMGDINGPEREGLVFKCNEFGPSFKCISNKYLLKSKE